MTANNATIPSGVPVAQPVYTVDATTGAPSTGGGGTQYTDGAAAPAHPVGTQIIFNNSGTETAVSAANGLPITGSITATNPSVGTDGSAIPTSSTLIGGSDGTNLQPLQVDGSKNLKITGTVNTLHGSSVDATNSSTTLLTANSVFTGTSQSSLNYSAISVEVFADQASAAGGLSVQQSTDGTNWDIKDTFSIVASTAFQTTVNLTGQNYRIVYTNGATNQGAFRLQTIKQTSESPLPRTLTALGNLKTAMQEALPAGANVIGQVTSNAGTNLNTSLLALEAGGNLATLVTNTADLLADGDNLATINTNTANIPAKGTAVMTGSTPVTIATNDTLTAAMKADLDTLVTNTADLLADGDNLATIATNTSNTATNTSGSKTDLDTIAGAVSGAKMQTNIAQVLGATMSATNPLITEASIQAFILNAQAYTCSTGTLNSTAAVNQAAQWFSANTSTKNVLIYSVRVTYTNATQPTQVFYITASDTGIVGAGTVSDIGNALNLKAGGAGQQASVRMDHNSGLTTSAGSSTSYELVATGIQNVVEVIVPSAFIYIPSGTAGGVSLFTSTTAGGKWGVSVKWIEF